ncbi:MAG: M28 family peptidase [Bacteroidaceae bacterium]|nr:M28 family peptidase [Bacteroidaceae bacterium]
MKKGCKYILILLVGLIVATATSCGGHTERKMTKADTIALVPCPVFSPDSAFLFIEEQCKFGPRVTGSKTALKCGDYLVEQFKRFGANVEEQKAEVTIYDGSKLEARNIIASVNPENKDRILFCAHWDTRPWADNDPNVKNHRKPVLGANDGASGVAVMLEMCRLLQQTPVKIGVDFVCFDAEDLGTPQWIETIENDEHTWCLGSRYWAEQAFANKYRARYGVLLDMVGGRGSTFSRELASRQYADPVVEMIWSLARQIGYRHYFPMTDGGLLVDDHLNVNRIARIPCLDIVPYFEYGPSSFGPTWHTVEDTPKNIDLHVLEAVGQTLVQLIYNEDK